MNFKIQKKHFSYKLGAFNLSIFLIRFLPVLLLTLCILNIIISGSIPLFSEGYIDRFEYIKNTKIWNVIGIFGVTTSIIPIMLSFGLLETKRARITESLIGFIVYSLYIILIGHKFGGLVQGAFLFLLPIFVIKAKTNGLKKVLLTFSKVGFVFIILLFGLIFYHYSSYSLAEDHGGAISFIFYRIFSLQGHTFWGVVNHLDIISASLGPDLLGLIEGMPNLMRLIGTGGVNEAIERGVNFTFGYFAAMPYFLGIFGIILLVFNSTFFSWISDLVVYSIVIKDPIKYFFAVNVFNDWLNFTESGTLGSILSAKSILIFSSLLLLIILDSINLLNRKHIKQIEC
ncbi:MAG: DUF6418 domain-containing protein [Bacteroidota bacterium]